MLTAIRLGTRKSPLAMAQTHHVAQLLQAAWPSLNIEILTFETQGDRILDQALSKVGEKGLFVKELEVALLENRIDLAIHSMKDLPGALPPGLSLCSVAEREDPRDVLLSKTGSCFEALPPGATVGTSSLRREAQLRRYRPDLNYQTVRGNLQTRYRKLMEDAQYDALVLAAAGVHRLGWQDRIHDYFDPWDLSIPAVAQGILGVEFRDDFSHEWLKPLCFSGVEVARRSERAFLEGVSGGCQLPMGAYCRLQNGTYEIKGVILSLDGSRRLEAVLPVDENNPEASGLALAEHLLLAGGREILDKLS